MKVVAAAHWEGERGGGICGVRPGDGALLLLPSSLLSAGQKV